MNNQITFYLMRHGEVENTQVLAGKTDIALSNTGELKILEALDSLRPKHCISSPLSRCLSTTTQWCNDTLCNVTVEQKIKECDFGDWDGKSYKQLWSMPTPTLGDFWQYPKEITPPNGESYREFETRISDWWHEFLSALTFEQDETLIVTHAGVIKLILAQILNVEDSADLLNKLKISYASPIKITVFIEGEKRWASLAL